MSTASSKASLRAELRRARRALPPALAAAESACSVATVQAWLAERPSPPALASYLALSGELDLDALHQAWLASGRPVWLPSVRGDNLDWHPVSSLDQVRPGAFGVREPDPGQVPVARIPAEAVVLVPGVGYGGDGRRLGQGGGFYDRFLARHRGPAIGVGFACQRADDLPLDPHDHPVAGVVLGGTWILKP